jgi:hypothetical protein
MATLTLCYNNYRIGNKVVFFSYSVLAAIAKGRLDNYWGRSGVMESIQSHLTPERVVQIMNLINGFPESHYEIYLNDRLSMNDLKTFQTDGAFYSLLVQTGYLTFSPTDDNPALPMSTKYVFMPNQELLYVWQQFIFQDIYQGKPQAFNELLQKINNLKAFEIGLSEALNNKLSYFDFSTEEPEKTYHVYVAGMMSALGYKWISNQESGLGRYDLLVQVSNYNLIFEFKVAKRLDDCIDSACQAICQIKEKLYSFRLNKEKPVLFIGVGFYKKMCKIVVEKGTYNYIIE